jgi:hypothetical protein
MKIMRNFNQLPVYINFVSMVARFPTAYDKFLNEKKETTGIKIFIGVGARHKANFIIAELKKLCYFRNIVYIAGGLYPRLRGKSQLYVNRPVLYLMPEDLPSLKGYNTDPRYHTLKDYYLELEKFFIKKVFYASEEEILKDLGI